MIHCVVNKAREPHSFILKGRESKRDGESEKESKREEREGERKREERENEKEGDLSLKTTYITYS